MSLKTERLKLRDRIKRDASRLARHEKDRGQVLVQTVYLTTLGVVIVLPIVVGAYVGKYLDEHIHGFSFSWTICLIVLGVFVGAINAWLLIKD